MIDEERAGDVHVALVGDSLISRKLSPFREPRYLEMVEIIRGGDVSVTNSETLFHRYEGSPVWDSGPGGTYVTCDPAIIDELKWLGITAVSTANNHAFDYGEEGILANLRNLDEHSLPHAGTGRTLSEAAAPVYVDTPKGRVAVIGVTLSVPAAGHRAGDPRGITKGRPGANVLRHQVTNTVPRPTFDALKDAGRNLALGPAFRGDGDEINFLGQKFVAGDGYSKASEANRFDLDLNLKWVADARRMADWVIVSMHNHERGRSADEPAEFARAFAHACIDAGADVIHGHGPHQDRGIEIYNGRPIFYALGNFIMQNDVVEWEPWDLFVRYGLGPEATPADIYDFRSNNDTRGQAVEPIRWQSAVATVDFCGGKLDHITLHPVDLGYETKKRSQRGRPVLADGAMAEEILNRFRGLSAPFGTKLEIENGRGVIRPG